MVEKKEGSKIWYFADGYLPLKGKNNEIFQKLDKNPNNI